MGTRDPPDTGKWNPVIPLNRDGESVRLDQCRRMFRSVLSLTSTVGAFPAGEVKSGLGQPDAPVGAGPDRSAQLVGVASGWIHSMERKE